MNENYFQRPGESRSAYYARLFPLPEGEIESLDVVEYVKRKLQDVKCNAK